MALYAVSYGSMTAHYGPMVIEAESEDEARRKFNARAAYEANGRKPFDAGFYEGLKLAVEILDAHEDKSVDFLSQALNEGNGTYKP